MDANKQALLEIFVIQRNSAYAIILVIVPCNRL